MFAATTPTAPGTALPVCRTPGSRCLRGEGSVARSDRSNLRALHATSRAPITATTRRDESSFSRTRCDGRQTEATTARGRFTAACDSGPSAAGWVARGASPASPAVEPRAVVWARADGGSRSSQSATSHERTEPRASVVGIQLDFEPTRSAGPCFVPKNTSVTRVTPRQPRVDPGRGRLPRLDAGGQPAWRARK